MINKNVYYESYTHFINGFIPQYFDQIYQEIITIYDRD